MVENSSVLIKPSSYLCNMKCEYCFYIDEVKERKDYIKKGCIMNYDTSFNIIDKFIKNTLYSISFIFQGGEPLLSGLDYYINFINTVNKLNTKNIKIYYSIQSNLTLLNDEYAKFFKKNNFLVGVSLDGEKLVNDKYRRIDSKGSYDLVLSKIELLKKYDVDFNILSVVTKDYLKNYKKIYKEYKKNNFRYIQFIKVLKPLNSDAQYTLTNKEYSVFLIKMFKYWYKDLIKGDRWSERYFDNLLNIIYGRKINECTLKKYCSKMYSIEASGDIYPCDFYMIDDYFIGNINTDSFELIDKKLSKSEFINKIKYSNDKCDKCKYLKLCGGGCRKDILYMDKSSVNYYCEAYYRFLSYSYPKFKHLVKLINKHKI